MNKFLYHIYLKIFLDKIKDIGTCISGKLYLDKNQQYKKKENKENKEQNLIHLLRIVMNVNEKEPLWLAQSQYCDSYKDNLQDDKHDEDHWTISDWDWIKRQQTSPSSLFPFRPHLKCKSNKLLNSYW